MPSVSSEKFTLVKIVGKLSRTYILVNMSPFVISLGHGVPMSLMGKIC